MTSDWHLSKTVTVGNMLTIFFAILALVGSYYTLDKRITIVERNQIDLTEHIKAENRHREKDIDRVCKKLERIEDLFLEFVMKEN